MSIPRSELEWLGQDIGEMRRILDTHPAIFKLLADTSHAENHILRLAVADLFWQVWYHAMAIHALLRDELPGPTVVIERALFEGIATLGYIHLHPNRATEAVVL